MRGGRQGRPEHQSSLPFGVLRLVAVLAITSWMQLPSLAFAADQEPLRPNIVLILADDLGWGSAGSYGADSALLQTPMIDRIAAEGMRFLDASTPSSVCSPTRYGLLTGRYAWRLGDKYRAHTFIPLLIEPGRLTLASLLQDVGYRTAAIGKWHLGYGSQKRVDYGQELRPGPLEVGFDYHFGVPSNHGDVTGVFVENHHVFGLRSKELLPKEIAGKNFRGMEYIGLDAPRRVDEDVLGTLTAKAVEWIENQEPSNPFFLYFAPVAVHRPVTPSKAVKGLSPAGPFGDWIADLDQSVGQIVAALEQGGFLEETLLIFTSDNGGVFNPSSDSEQTLAFNRGLRVNGPFRGGKRSVYEGGFRVPLLVRWPQVVRAGTVSDVTVSLVDILATLAEAIGVELPPPAEAAEDSLSFLQALVGQESSRPRRAHEISVSSDENYAIRWGPWKWIEGIPHDSGQASTGQREHEHQPQLYNLRDDVSEQRNLISASPAVAGLMEGLLNHYRSQGFSRAARRR
jgi:arylsulfatase A